MIKNMAELKKKLINRRQLQEKFGGCSKTSIFRWMRNGVISRSIKIGLKNYWHESEIDAYIDSLNPSRPKGFVKGLMEKDRLRKENEATNNS